MSAAPEMAPSGDDQARGYRAQTLLSFVRLKWFIHLRWIMLACCVGALAIDAVLSRPARRPLQLFVVIVGLTAINIVWVLCTSGLRKRVREGETDRIDGVRGASILANAQIAVDLFALTLLLRYSGGVENPMAMFYLFHVAIAALLLTAREVFVHAFWAILLYTLMAFGELAEFLTPHYPFLPALPDLRLHQQPGFVFCAIFITSTSIFGMLYFMLRIVARVASHERNLAQAICALRESKAAISALQQRKAMFMRTAAHQLKTPLAAIQTQVSLLREGLVPAGEVRTLYDRIVARCREGIGQVTDLLVYARMQDLDADRHAAARTDAVAVVQAVCDRYAPIARQKGVTLKRSAGPAQAGLVRVDAADLADCLANLLDNAIKYTPGGGDVTVSHCVDGGAAVIEVFDSGMGMTEATRAHLFEPYRRGSEAILADIPGSGLGMSIVQAVVEQAKGRVNVESAPGRGTRVRVAFPLVADTPSSAATWAEKGTLGA